MKISTNNKSFSIWMIILGAALVITAVLLNIYKGDELKSLAGVCIGIGAMLISLFAAKLFGYFYGEKHPDMLRKKNIEVNDERNTHIREKPGAKVNGIFNWLLFAAILVFILLDVELYVTLVLSGMIVVNGALHALYYNYYNKRL